MLQVIFGMPYHGTRRTRQARGWDDDVIKTTHDITSAPSLQLNFLFSLGARWHGLCVIYTYTYTYKYTYIYIYIYIYNPSQLCHISVMAFQVTDNYTVYTKARSGWQQRKHESSLVRAFFKGIHRWHPLTEVSIAESVPYHDVILFKNIYLNNISISTRLLLDMTHLYAAAPS